MNWKFLSGTFTVLYFFKNCSELFRKLLWTFCSKNITFILFTFFPLLAVSIKLGQIELFSIRFGTNQILELCFLQQIKTTQKLVIHILKRNETKWFKMDNSTRFTPKRQIVLNTYIHLIQQFLMSFTNWIECIEH